MTSRLSPAQVQRALRAAAAAPAGRAAAAPRNAPGAAPAANQGAARGAGEVRIIGGQWKRTRLAVPVLPGLRPTPDRVRETLFNWLGQDLTGWRCFDTFAGTGALGLEAASRGAASVLLVEQDAALAARLQQHVQRLQAQAVQVRRGDGLAQLRQCPAASLDLVFIDPPFGSTLFQSALQAAAQALAPQGRIYLEAPQAWDDAALAPLGLTVLRHLRAGMVHAHLLGRGA
ncbi:MAG: 16S rRNA (guanine(966)-N(2))-methyltransferase RsmD [Burkholderiales bacterium 68-12]|nr:MAG: 16S rRNA (guanine(966)-N(2))-methyltransferase RsmD [Burkholderiales bacterium 68-12]